MPDQTPTLQMPYIMPSQAQKHVTHNQALDLLDAVVQLSVLSRAVADPPGSPSQGDRYLIPDGATGAWSGHAGEIAVSRPGGWSLIAPGAGWLAWVADEDLLSCFDGADWIGIVPEAVNPVAMVGVNATADASNRLALAAEASLFSHDGDDHRVKINKASSGDTASVLFQTAWSGRAEFGIAGSDAFSVKVSPDGAAWITALAIDHATGAASFTSGVSIVRSGGAANVAIVRTDGVAANLQVGTSAGRFLFESTGDFFISDNTRANIIAGTSGGAGRDFIKCTGASGEVDLCGETAGALTMHGGSVVIDASRHHRLRAYTVATLPSATPAAQVIYVSDGSSNRRMAVSDGTNWRFPDGTVVS